MHIVASIFVIIFFCGSPKLVVGQKQILELERLHDFVKKKQKEKKKKFKKRLPTIFLG